MRISRPGSRAPKTGRAMPEGAERCASPIAGGQCTKPRARGDLCARHGRDWARGTAEADQIDPRVAERALAVLTIDEEKKR